MTTIAVQTDTQLADLYGREQQISQYLDSSIRTLTYALGHRGQRPPLSTLLEQAEISESINVKGAVKNIAEYRAQLAEIRREQMPLEETYNQQRWSRFFLVTNTNGHIHSSLSCSTCYVGTEYAWLPNLSGSTEEDAVAEWGGILCTVCFPSAPVEHTTGVNKKTAAERAARDTERAAKRAAEAEKAITSPDGSPLRGKWGIVATLVTARRELVEALADVVAWETHHTDHPNFERIVAENTQTAARLIDAIAAKTGETIETVHAEALAKAEKKYRRDYA